MSISSSSRCWARTKSNSDSKRTWSFLTLLTESLSATI
jgi:hypothetical protein